MLFRSANKAHPERGGCTKGYGKNAGKTLTVTERREELKALRGRWENLTNLHLRRAGHEKAQICLRSYKDQRYASSKTPEPKMKPGQWHKPDSPERDAIISARAERAANARKEQEAAELNIRIISTRESVINSDPERKALAWEFSGIGNEQTAARICSDYEALKKHEADVKREAFRPPDERHLNEGYVASAERQMKRTEEACLETSKAIENKGFFSVMTASGRRLKRDLESQTEQHLQACNEYNKQYDIFEKKIKPIREQLQKSKPGYDQAKAYLDQNNDVRRALEQIEGSPEHRKAVQQQKQDAERAKKEAQEAAERRIREQQVTTSALRRGAGGMKI